MELIVIEKSAYLRLKLQVEAVKKKFGTVKREK